MKNNSIKKALALVAATAAVAAMPSVAAFAVDGDLGYTTDQINASTIKPYITAPMIVLDKSEAGSQQTINIEVNAGQTGYFASTGIHIYYDERLKIETDPFGDISVKGGSAVQYLDALLQGLIGPLGLLPDLLSLSVEVGRIRIDVLGVIQRYLDVIEHRGHGVLGRIDG